MAAAKHSDDPDPGEVAAAGSEHAGHRHSDFWYAVVAVAVRSASWTSLFAPLVWSASVEWRSCCLSVRRLKSGGLAVRRTLQFVFMVLKPQYLQVTRSVYTD